VKKEMYLFDTHALIFWNNKEFVSEEFVNFFDKQVQRGPSLYFINLFLGNCLVGKERQNSNIRCASMEKRNIK